MGRPTALQRPNRRAHLSRPAPLADRIGQGPLSQAGRPLGARRRRQPKFLQPRLEPSGQPAPYVDEGASLATPILHPPVGKGGIYAVELHHERTDLLGSKSI